MVSSMPATITVRCLRPRSASIPANGPSSGSATVTSGSPGAPKSRAAASGKTTSSAPPLAASAVSLRISSRFTPGSRLAVNCAIATRMRFLPVLGTFS